MSVSVTMPRLGESVSEGTVTRWLKQEGERVEADEPLLEVSTDKVDTEIPAPASGVVSSIKVAEDETVEVGVELAVIEEAGAGGGTAQEDAGEQPAEAAEAGGPEAAGSEAAGSEAAGSEAADGESRPAAARTEPQQEVEQEPEPAAQPAAAQARAVQSEQDQQAESSVGVGADTPGVAPAAPPTAPEGGAVGEQQPARAHQETPFGGGGGGEGFGTYVTPLVRRLAAEHSVDLTTLSGTGVGGRIRKQDVLEAARGRNGAGNGAPAQAPAAQAAAVPAQAAPAATPQPQAPAAASAPSAAPAAAAQQPAAQQPAAQAPAEARPAAQAGPSMPAAARGRTEKLSRLRTLIAHRMVESLQVSAQLTTIVEADVTRIARLRERAKDAFAAREGVRLSFLPFFAVATCEALRVHPNLNASVDIEQGTITYHDSEDLGIAVDTDRGLLVPVIHSAGDLNLAGIARKIADLAERTRANKVSPDELGGGTFTLTNTGSRGALIDTPIINQPQVGILGTGSVVKRPAVIDDPELGEVIAVRSSVYLSLTYDHRVVDGADAARFLTSIKERLEEAAFEGELGL